MRSLAAAHLDRLGEAQAASLASLSLRPDEPYALAAHGFQQMHMGHFREARATFSNVLQLDPVNLLARRGLIETIKASNLFYRVILRYFLWTSRLSRGQTVVVLFGGPSLFRLFWRTLELSPATRGLALGVAVLWGVFVLSTWLAIPLSNLALLLHPLGRHALDPDERTGALLIGSLLAASLVGLAAWVAGFDAGALLALTACAAALSVSAAFKAERGWPRWALAVLASVVVGAGAAAVVLAFTHSDWTVGASPAWIACGVSVMACGFSQYAALVLTRVQPAR